MAGSDATTEPLPTARPAQDAVVTTKPRKRGRGLRAIVVVVVVAALLVGGYFVAEYYAKQYATNYVRDRVASALELKSPAAVHVSLGSGSLILQALSGRITAVRLSVDPLTEAGLTGSAVVTARGVPLDSSQPVDRLRVNVTIPASTISAGLRTIPLVKPLDPTFSVSGKHAVFAGKLALFGQSIPVGVTATPGVVHGRPNFAIDEILLGKNRIPAAQLAVVVPGLTDFIESGQSLCIANALPKSFVLTGVGLHHDAVVLGFDGDGAVLDQAALSVKGSCTT